MKVCQNNSRCLPKAPGIVFFLALKSNSAAENGSQIHLAIIQVLAA
jgi:hypothetical protein